MTTINAWPKATVIFLHWFYGYFIVNSGSICNMFQEKCPKWSRDAKSRLFVIYSRSNYTFPDCGVKKATCSHAVEDRPGIRKHWTHVHSLLFWRLQTFLSKVVQKLHIILWSSCLVYIVAVFNRKYRRCETGDGKEKVFRNACISKYFASD